MSLGLYYYRQPDYLGGDEAEEVETEEDDDDTVEMYDIVRPMRISGQDVQIGFNLNCMCPSLEC